MKKLLLAAILVVAAVFAVACVGSGGGRESDFETSSESLAESENTTESRVEEESKSESEAESEGEEVGVYRITVVRADGKVEEPIKFDASNYESVFFDVVANRLTQDDEQYSYEWKDDLPEEFELRDYVLTEVRTIKKYEVTFLNYDGSVWAVAEFEYGSIPVCEKTPKRASVGKYSYEFIGWNEDLKPVTGDSKYTAVYKERVDTETDRIEFD